MNLVCVKLDTAPTSTLDGPYAVSNGLGLGVKSKVPLSLPAPGPLWSISFL